MADAHHDTRDALGVDDSATTRTLRGVIAGAGRSCAAGPVKPAR